MYADTPEFTSHLLTSVLPRDNDDPVSSSDTETRTIHVCDLRLSRLSFFLSCEYFIKQNINTTRPYNVFHMDAHENFSLPHNFKKDFSVLSYISCFINEFNSLLHFKMIFLGGVDD